MARKAEKLMALSFGKIMSERPKRDSSARFRIAPLSSYSGRFAKVEIGHIGRRQINLDAKRLDKVIAEITKPQVNRINMAQSIPFEQLPAVPFRSCWTPARSCPSRWVNWLRPSANDDCRAALAEGAVHLPTHKTE